ncbi:MAG: hypothetical protein NT105_03810 [Verrucomicrobia bacterium]|nr:hypothetical protein [Verrucomicrobiota bacterium]
MKIIRMPVATMTPAQLVLEGQGLLDKLADNAVDFPTPPVTDLTTHKGQLVAQFGEMATLEGQVDSKRQQIKDTAALVRDDMNALGEWGEGVTEDPIKLAKVYQLRTAPAPSHMVKVEALNATMGDHAGETDLGWHGQGKNVQFYEPQSSPDVMPRVWQNEQSCKGSKTTIGGKTSGAFIVWRVRAVGANDTGEWSDIALCLVP